MLVCIYRFVVQLRQLFQVPVDGTAVDYAAVGDPQPDGEITTGGAGPSHGRQLGPVPFEAALAVTPASCSNPEGADSFNFLLRIKCLLILSHMSVLLALSRETRQSS